VAINPNTGAMLVLATGGIAFTTKFYYAHDVDWKIVIATPLAAAGFAAFGKLDANAAMALGAMALMAAATTKFNGHSFTDILLALGKGTSPAATPATGDGGATPAASPPTTPTTSTPSGDAPSGNTHVPVQVHPPGPG
jgi:hypothetical protein